MWSMGSSTATIEHPLQVFSSVATVDTINNVFMRQRRFPIFLGFVFDVGIPARISCEYMMAVFALPRNPFLHQIHRTTDAGVPYLRPHLSFRSRAPLHRLRLLGNFQASGVSISTQTIVTLQGFEGAANVSFL